MAMHGLHGFDQLSYFKDKSNNEIIVLLEEMIKSEKLADEVDLLQSQLKKAGIASCEPT